MRRQRNPHHKHRFTPAMVLALLALATLSAPFAAPKATAKEADQTWYAFTDIHGHWAMGPILQMAESLGFSKTDTAFRPDDPIEGPVWTAWLTRLLPQARACIDIYPKPPECSALGSPQEGPLTRQALVADLRQALSVTPGVYNPHFRPDPMPVDLPPKDTAEFQLAWDGLSWGYLEGYPDGTLRLEQVATRAEAVQMLSRVPRLFDRSILQETSDAQALLQAASDAFHLFTHVEKDSLPRWQEAVNRLFAGGFRRFWVDTDVLHAAIGFDTARMKALLAVENTEGTGMNWAVFDLSFRFHNGEWQIEDFSIVETHENTPEAQVPRYDRAWIIGPEVTP